MVSSAKPVPNLQKPHIIQFIITINPVLILVYLRKQGWPDLPHSNSNLSNSHSPSCSIQGILPLQTNTLALSLSTCTFHVFLGRPQLFLPFTSNSNAFLKTYPSPSPTHACTISLHSPLPSEPPSPSIPTSITNQKLLHEHILEEKKKTDFILQHSTGYWTSCHAIWLISYLGL